MDTLTLDMRVISTDRDAERAGERARQLRTAILATDVDEARPASGGPAPAGAKSGEVLAVGALAVTLAPVVLESLMGVVASWLSRQPDDIELEIDGQRFRGHVTKAQRDELVAAYLRRLDAGR
ncbi:hypothetical protein [Couchioplanes azureus]|uniref:hypothetical protein n=1 Tax=Couchioplanes caeruleus TaxID=56438 RepID=UPI001E3BF410|nr:hypothetical protein [Couchioplanes caeruleus]